MPHVTDAYFEQTVATLQQMIRFDSSLKADGATPFGQETADCLRSFLSLAENMGFITHNYDDYAGEILFGEGKDLAILAHLDVVPAGSGWTYPPFAGVINDDESKGGVKGRKIWGRGAMDDKGPAVSCLYALKALKDEGFRPKRKIKFILGCNEESGWKCIDYYRTHAVMPEEGFTPDADFPAIYAEKGILHLQLTFPLTTDHVRSLQGGQRANMVCDEVTAHLSRRAGNALALHRNPVPGTSLTYDNTTGVMRCTGKSAHGSTPEKGANALYCALCFLANIDDGAARAYQVLANDCLGLTEMRDETGPLTMSAGIVSLHENRLQVTVDIRFPATHEKEKVLSAFERAGIQAMELNYQAPIYNRPNETLISTLMGVYNSVTGKNERPVAIGGGTYARALKKGCAFGPEMAGDEVTIHQPDEYITFERLKLLNEIYYEAIKRLCQ